MAFGTITSTSNTFGSVDGTATGVVPGTLTGSVGVPGPAGPGVPAGGLEGQIIVKASETDYDTVWVDNSAETLTATVRNETGATLTKGTVVYINGASGNKATVTKASAATESGSSKTFAILKDDIPNNQNGTAVTVGLLKGVDTSAFSPGANLWLSTTAGQITQTMPTSPNHAVFLGNAVRIHANQGEIEVRIQNGLELGELHDVLLTSPTNGQVLKYDATSGLWKNGTDVGGVAWGGITGTLSDQTDLQTALDGKYSTSNPAGYITSSALTGYATESFVTSQGYITSAALSPYLLSSTAASTYFTIASADGKADITGDTFTGKVNFTPVSGVAGLNVGIGGTSAASTTAGDIWISTGGASLNFRDGNGSWRILAATSNTNAFSAPQIVDTTATTAALRVTQKGTGNAIEVEDSTTPDATRFVVDQFGKVGIGVAPDATAALKVDTNGIMFGDGTTQTTAATGGGSYSSNQAIADLITGSILYAVDEGMGTLLCDTRDESAGSRFPTFLSGLNWSLVSVNGQTATWSNYGEFTVPYDGGPGIPWYISYNGVQASLPFGNFGSP